MVLLRGDCSACFGLCCVGLALQASGDFAIDKEAGQPCPHLGTDHRCTIHTELRQRGFPGCRVFECFGAGQRVSTHTFAGRQWREHPELATRMFAVFGVMRQLHELLWHLDQAAALTRRYRAAARFEADLVGAMERVEVLAQLPAAQLDTLRLEEPWQQTVDLLSRVSERIRAGEGGKRQDFRGTDLAGRDFRGRNLVGANLRGACLVGANLSGTRLRLADFTGADLRGAKLGGTDLSETLFLSQPQVDSATGNPATRLPSALTRPDHW